MPVTWSQRPALRHLLSSFLRCFTPPERLSVTEWSDRYRYLSRETSSKFGKYLSSYQPLQRGPMDAVDDPNVRAVVLMFASQVIGKSEITNNVIGRHIDIDPCPLLRVEPTLAMAEAWSKDKFAPMLRDTPRLQGKVKDPRTRDSGNTILHKTFPGGSLTVAGANSPASLAARAIRVLVLDEVDRFPMSAGTEGDPVALAEKRTESYPDAITILASTPTIEGQSRIAIEYELSDKCKWFCPCPRCKQQQTLEWEQVRWPEDKPEEAYYECCHCHAHLNDDDRLAMIYAGEWRATAPFKGIRGYHANALYTTFKAKRGYGNRLHQFSEEFLSAKQKGAEALRVFVNTVLTRTWSIDYEAQDTEPLLKRREKYPDHLPEGVLLVTAGADVQLNRIEVTVYGWGLDEESWAIEHRVIVGNTTTPQPWNDLDQFLQTTWRTKNGVELAIVCTAVDSGNNPKSVYEFCRRRVHRRIFPVKGRGGMAVPLVGRPSLNNRARVPLYTVGVDCAKSLLMTRLKIDEAGPGFIHFPKGHGFDGDYFKQLLAEAPQYKIRGGLAVRVWVKKYSRNEALDCAVYALAALGIIQPNFEMLYRKIEKKIERLKAEAKQQIGQTSDTGEVKLADTSLPDQAKPVKKPARQLLKRRTGWVSGWKKW